MYKKPTPKEINLSQCRWMMFLKSGKVITENHSHGITWKKAYKENYQNIQAVCFQLIPGRKIFAEESPYGEYWNYEEMEVIAGQSTPTHISRSICSMMEQDILDINTSKWKVKTIYVDGSVTESIKTGKEIGYSIRNFLNKDEKMRI
jgi:hypothetical protein